MTKEVHEAPASMMRFEGTAMEIGGQIWERMCLPAVRHTSNNADATTLAQLYAGIILAGMGAMAADFGHEMAAGFYGQIGEILKDLAKTDPAGGMTQ